MIGPRYEDVRLYAEVKPLPHYVGRFPDLKLMIEQRLRAFIHPLPGPGHFSDDAGWPIGRTLHKSELYYVIEKIPGVDYVETLSIWGWMKHARPEDGMRSEDQPPQSDTIAWERNESQDNIYIERHAFHYFREIEINQV